MKQNKPVEPGPLIWEQSAVHTCQGDLVAQLR